MRNREAILNGAEFVVEAVASALAAVVLVMLLPILIPFALVRERKARSRCDREGHPQTDPYWTEQARKRPIWCDACGRHYRLSARDEEGSVPRGQ